jgi:hypothetical protein
MKWVFIVVAVLVVFVAVVAIIGAFLPKSHTASRSSRFKQTPPAIWSAITGPPEWRPDIRGFEELPRRDGRRAWKETDKHGQVIAYESIEEIPPTRLVTRIADPKLPFGGTWTIQITPEGGGCMLNITEAGEIYNPIFRFVSRFVLGYSGSIEAYLKALHAKFGEAGE